MNIKPALLAITAATTLAISGCASTANNAAERNSLAAMAGQPVGTKIAEPSSFLLSTPENNRVPLVRVATMIREGGQILSDHQIADPAGAIAAGIARQLENSYGARPAAPASAARFVVEVKTGNWGLFFKASEQEKYGLVYSANVQLTDVQKGSVIASGFCKPDIATIRTATREQFLSNSAAGLKAEFARVADECVKFISSQILSL